MSTSTLPIAADDIIETRRSAWQATLHFCRREPLGAFGMLIVIIMVVTGVSAEFIAPYSPTANDFASMTEPPSWEHWLGYLINSAAICCRGLSMGRALR